MEEIDKLLKQAYQSLDEGDYQKALSKFDKVVKTDPNNAEAWFGKAEAGVLVPKAKTEDILAAYRKAAELYPKNPLYHSSMGSFCVETGLFNDAEAAYKMAAELATGERTLLSLRVRGRILQKGTDRDGSLYGR